MTDKLYLKDSYLLSVETHISEIIDEGNCLSVVFTVSPFFPGGGGQPSDSGLINEIPVIEAYEQENVIYHRLKDKNFPYSVGDIVLLSVDEKIRFERMRAHTGEHIVSGIAHNLYGAENVGFHMDENGLMTVDFDKYFDKSVLAKIEIEANKCVMADAEIKASIYSSIDIEGIEFRSKLEFKDDVRIVEINGIDRCACCAPHLKTTGEVGSVKILSSASHRGGVRITLVCGLNSYLEFQRRYRQVLDISALLCSKYDECVSCVAELIENNKKLKNEKEQIRNEFLLFIASKIQKSDIIVEFFDQMNIDDLRRINNYLTEKCGIISLLFSGSDEQGYCYCIYSDKLQLAEFFRDFKAALNGTGGGKGAILQGRVKATKNEIYRFISGMKVESYENA